MKKKKDFSADLATKLNISPSRALEATLKAKLIAAIISEVNKQGYTHAELAKSANMARSTVTGILSGSLQKITIDRTLRLAEAAGLSAEIKIKRVA